MIEVKNLSFAYDGDSVPVWHNLNTVLHPGEINLILGPSGCGKSTFLYALNRTVPCCFEGDLEGQVFLNGTDISDKTPALLSGEAGLVFQDPECQFCTFTVEDEIAFGLENLCVPVETYDARIDEVLDLLGMGDHRDALLSSLSGGQKQKIAIGCMLATDPDLLLLDEPTSNLDARSREEVFDLLRKLRDEGQRTIVLVEHNVDGILELVEHMVVFDRAGNICLTGSPAEVLEALLFRDEYRSVQVFLSQELLLLREWAAAASPAVRHQLKAYLETGDLSRVTALLKETEHVPSAKAAVPEGETVLSLEHMAFAYQKQEPILKDVTFSVKEGEFIALLGANGAGKTTLLNVIFASLPGYSGSITVAGKEVSRYKKRDLYERMGLVFQNPEWQFVANTVWDELAFSLKYAKISEEEKEERILSTLERFHLTEMKDKSPFSMSQGQKRRLSVATMLLTGQKVLFFDEPTYGQDHEQRQELMALIDDLNRSGVTVIMVTHDMAVVAEHARRVLVLQDGCITFDGTPDALFAEKQLLAEARLTEPPLAPFARKVRELCPWLPETADAGELLRALLASEGGEG